MGSQNSDYDKTDEVGIEKWQSAKQKIIELLDEMMEQTAEIDERIQALLNKLSR